MVKNIEPKLKKIGDYLRLEDDTIFTIPEYQRAYSWGIEHCDKLWQDITEFADSESKDRYFFGTIIINCQKDDAELALIDGQQRTTTFLLLLKALLLKINNAIEEPNKDDESEGLYRGLQERRRRIMGILYKAETEDISDIPDLEKDKVICNRVSILKNNSINEVYKLELQTILKAVNFEEIEKSVVKIPYKQKDNKYTNFFKNFKYFYDKIAELKERQLNKIAKEFTDSCEVIEIKSWQVEQAITMFNSLNADGLPLYDSDIIAAKLYANAALKNKESEFKERWEDFLKQIGELKFTKTATIDSILMQQMYYERAKRREIITETNSVNVTTPGVRRYFTEINRDLLCEPIQLCNGMTKLASIWNKVSNYPLIQVLSKFNENSKLFLAGYFYRFEENEISEDRIKVVCECMLRLFTILELVDTGYSSTKFKTFLFKESVDFVNSNISEDKIKTDFDAHICMNWSKDELNDEIIAYDKNSLVYLNEYLFAKDNNIKFNLGTKYDIEHIMPDSGKNLQEIRKDANIQSEDEFKGIVNKIGNKIVLEEKINRSIGNEWFRTKVSTKLEDKTGYVDSVFPIAQYLVSKYKSENKPYWRKEDIIQATNEAKDRILKFIFGE